MPKFRLPALPSFDCDSAVEIADLWEIVALRAASATASLNDLRSIVQKQAEADPESDADEDIGEESRYDFAMEEIRYRLAACGPNKYPFDFLANSERVIEFRRDSLNEQRLLYVFLLLTTRLNMLTRRSFCRIDGTLLFEEICEIALGSMWGDRVISHRFGTSAEQGNFPEKLKSFFAALGEFELRSDRRIPHHGGDDGIDVATWNTFSWTGDSREPQGKLIVLTQCKTGTSWDKADLERLQPNTFFAKWMTHTPLGQQVRAFMVSARVDVRDWEDHHRHGGLFFDRCRIVDYAVGRLPGGLFDRVRLWTQAALNCPDLGTP